MEFQYRVTDLQTGESYEVTSAPGEFFSYVHFIGELEALNVLWRGELKYEEIRERCLTSEYEMV